MKTLRFLALFCALAFTLCEQPGCTTAPSGRVAAVQTLKAVGLSAKTAMDASTELLKRDTITVAQWEKVASFYDNRFQPAYRLAVTAVNSDFSSLASPDLVNLAIELNALVASLKHS